MTAVDMFVAKWCNRKQKLIAAYRDRLDNKWIAEIDVKFRTVDEKIKLECM
jgi:hypothetical protein